MVFKAVGSGDFALMKAVGITVLSVLPVLSIVPERALSRALVRYQLIPILTANARMRELVARKPRL